MHACNRAWELQIARFEFLTTRYATWSDFEGSSRPLPPKRPSNGSFASVVPPRSHECWGAERAGFDRSGRRTDLDLTIDTFAWVEILRDSRQGRSAREKIANAERCFSPSIVLAELAAALQRDGFSDGEIRGELRAVGEASDVTHIDSSIAIGAAHSLAELRSRARARSMNLPGLADALILATARSQRTSILTGDCHFVGLEETVWLE